MPSEFSNLIEFIKWHLDNDNATYIGVRHDGVNVYFGVIVQEALGEVYSIPYRGNISKLHEKLARALKEAFANDFYPLIFSALDGSMDYVLVLGRSVFVDFPPDNQTWIYSQAVKDDFPPIEVDDELFPDTFVDDEETVSR